MTTTKSTGATRAGTVLATRPLLGWRTVDLLTIAFLGVAFGVAYWGYGLLYNGPISALGLALGFLVAVGRRASAWRNAIHCPPASATR